MLFSAATQTQFGFPQTLTEKYRPRAIGEFVGLEKVKRVLTKFADAPMPCSFLFVGPSGCGKTTMALALGEAIRAEIHHIPSQKCNAQAIDDVVRQCWFAPMNGTFHVVVVDESDKMSNAAQLALLSKLDSTAAPPQTVWVFTCNTTDGLEPRFLSRTMQLSFSSQGLAEPTAELLARIWQSEAGTAEAPNFLRIIRDSKNNVRDALNSLQVELLAA